MIEGQTNVRPSRFGAGAIDGIGKELGRFVVATMEVPWRLAQPRLGAKPAAVLFVKNMEIETLDRQAADAPECDTILAIGLAGRPSTWENISPGNGVCGW